MKNLRLERPVAFIDIESTGLSVSSDRIVELSVLKVQPDGTEEQKTKRFNPQIPISAEATSVHGITDEDVADEPYFRQFARALAETLEGCDIAGFGVRRFDLPLLEAELKRADVEFSREGRRVLDAMVIYHKLDRRNLAAAYSRYCGKVMERPHSAADDARAAADVLDAQIGEYPELSQDVAELHAFCNPDEDRWIDSEGKFQWVDGLATVSFGQHSGKSLSFLAENEADYLQWIVGADFPADVKEIAAGALRGELPKPTTPEPEGSPDDVPAE
jgi:DNA polymerase-3 subunit epsilon